MKIPVLVALKATFLRDGSEHSLNLSFLEAQACFLRQGNLLKINYTLQNCFQNKPGLCTVGDVQKEDERGLLNN